MRQTKIEINIIAPQKILVNKKQLTHATDQEHEAIRQFIRDYQTQFPAN